MDYDWHGYRTRIMWWSRVGTAGLLAAAAIGLPVLVLI
jgi:hypothetical protein